MPGSLLPLHVYEPRYRALVTHCLTGNQFMGVATLCPGYKPNYLRSPPIHPEIGVGRIVAHKQFGDGRWDIVLQSVGRAVVAEEYKTEHSFRLVRADLGLDDPAGMVGPVDQLRSLLLQVGCASEESAVESRRMAGMEPIMMVDELARRILRGSDAQRHYLSLDSVADRASAVSRRLAEMLTMDGTPKYEA